MEGNKNFDFEAAEKEQAENANKVQADAVTQAKENIAKRKAEEDARKAERCLTDAENKTNAAVKDARFASKKRNILKKYTEDLQAAKEEFEKTGDTKKWNEVSSKLAEEKDTAITNAKKDVYGDEYRWY